MKKVKEEKEKLYSSFERGNEISLLHSAARERWKKSKQFGCAG